LSCCRENEGIEVENVRSMGLSRIKNGKFNT
jgi:hypothetical protein